ncbi:MAG: adenine-specific methyltransferase EcoRI family protein [Cellvibrionales bacterium]|nr:adenine-specific methyltransferase EcoRI family protein [Cellvibrionales bacterium]
MSNKSLNTAIKAKNDEFYTQLSDIENEMRHYKPLFRGKAVYCNCDDPRVSKFFHYFSYNFEHLGLKKLITTCYKSQNPDMFSQHDSERAIMLEYDGFRDGDRIPRPEDIGIKLLEEDGDFRNPECIELLKQVDIVVTNPPFSLFREYVAQLMQHEKQFIIIGNKNAITYKEIFPLIRDNKLWLGINPMGRDMLFDIPADCVEELLATKKEGSAYRVVDGVIKRRLGNAAWYTNLPHKRRNEEMILFRKYSPENYPTYDNYDAIEVSKISDIPEDYAGVMGVPITFLDKYNPDQFEILGSNCSIEHTHPDIEGRGPSLLNGKSIFKRIFIRNKALNS